VLNLKDIFVHYGGVQAVKGVSLEVAEGSITSLIGANGAGKSTTLRAISGLVPLTAGEIWFEGKRIDGEPPEKIFSLGIVHVPEGKRLFLEMSVLDNLLAGAYLRKDKDRLGTDLERIYNYFPVLGKARHRPASRLSGGEQQMLAIGRGLMADPRLLLLDEPSLGLSPILTKEVGSIIKRIAEEKVPILLVEQNASLAFQLAQRIYVMETGTIALKGDPSTLQNNPHVRKAYLGISAAEEISYTGVLSSEAPRATGTTVESEIRWQDKAPQGRWQDRVPQGRWQDRSPGEGRAPAGELHVERGPAREAGPMVRPPQERDVLGRRPEDRPETEPWKEEPRPPERWPEDRRPQESELPDRWFRETGSLERWAEEKRPEQRRLDERWTREMEGPQRWPEGGYAFERWPEGGELFERWPGGRRPLRQEPPVRVVKKTFVPEVRTVNRSPRR
jgi:branched-chain amino acid transport system ATP-binding protein